MISVQAFVFIVNCHIVRHLAFFTLFIALRGVLGWAQAKEGRGV